MRKNGFYSLISVSPQEADKAMRLAMEKDKAAKAAALRSQRSKRGTIDFLEEVGWLHQSLIFV